MKKLILTVEDLSLSFSALGTEIKAIDNVSFELFSGEILGIVGESGSGKSVLVKSIVGLNTSAAIKVKRGGVLYKGTNLRNLSEKELRNYRGKEIGMIFQDPISSLNPTMRVGDQVKESLLAHNKSIDKKAAHEKVLELFTLVGIPSPEEIFYYYPYQLSGGMRQRVMIAIALAPEPKILIADEPTTALDVTIQAQILALLKDIQKKLQMSIIFITHDLSLISEFCNRVLVMYGGSIVENSDIETIFNTPSHPYTQKLIESIPRLDTPFDQYLVAIEGSPPALTEKIKGCKFSPRCPHAMKICAQKKPPLYQINGATKSACWLHHESLKERRSSDEKAPAFA